ncbi:MAG: hypothetical protein OXI81_04785 [Paracoccaceae bacterium]|nr:hypothetical protein [Paracoccaceae bacterium]
MKGIIRVDQEGFSTCGVSGRVSPMEARAFAEATRGLAIAGAVTGRHQFERAHWPSVGLKVIHFACLDWQADTGAGRGPAQVGEQCMFQGALQRPDAILDKIRVDLDAASVEEHKQAATRVG